MGSFYVDTVAIVLLKRGRKEKEKKERETEMLNNVQTSLYMKLRILCPQFSGADFKQYRFQYQIVVWDFFAGMTTRHFRGIPSIQEVECWGGNLDSDLKLMSLQMYKFSDSAVLASLNLYTKNCMTYGDFSSCVINPVDAHKSRLRLLVHDLREGESRKYKCTVIGVKPSGITKTSTWSITVNNHSEWSRFLHTGHSYTTRLFLIFS